MAASSWQKLDRTLQNRLEGNVRPLTLAWRALLLRITIQVQSDMICVKLQNFSSLRRQAMKSSKI